LFILDTFPIVRRHEEERYGEYRTRRLILESYDKLAGVPVSQSPRTEFTSTAAPS
jgi:hypothetical protein